MKKNFLKIIFSLFILSVLMIPINISAATNTNVKASSCPFGGTGTPIDNNNGSYYDTFEGRCGSDTTGEESKIGGIFQCAEDVLHPKTWTGDFFNLYTEDSTKVRWVKYIIGRIDTWIGNGGTWAINSGLNVRTCPEMSLSFNTETEIFKSSGMFNDGTVKKNAKIVSIEKLNFDDEHAISVLGTQKLEDIKQYSVVDYSITNKSVDWKSQITDADGNLKNQNITYDININKLSTYNPFHGLGFNGRSAYLVGAGRALHYLVPVKLVIEFDSDNPPPPKNPCVDGENGKTSQQYAYEHPGVCCYEYPETCCDNLDKINEIKNTKPDVLNFCCNQNSDLAAYGDSEKNGLPKLWTFIHWFNEGKMTKEQIDELCPNYNTCDDINAYYYDKYKNQPSLCCQTHPLSDKKLQDTRCSPEKPKEEGTCEVNKCKTDDSYFDSNRACCCEKNPGDDRCGWDIDVDENGLSCSSTPTLIDANFGTGTVASGTNVGGDTKENISFTSYNRQDFFKSNIIKAGTGFENNISVRHQVLKTADSYYDYYSSCSDENCAENSAKNAIKNKLGLSDDMSVDNSLLTSEINKVIDTSDMFYLEVDGTKNAIKDDYESFLQGTSNKKLSDLSESDRKNIIKKHNITTGYVYATYKSSYSCNCKNNVCETCYTTGYKYFMAPIQRLTTYVYDIKLKEKRISKTTLTSKASSSTSKDFVEGGRKAYTDVSEKTGIYNFYVKLKDTATGVTGVLANYNSNKGFACKLGIVNRIRNNDSFKCGTVQNPLPCDEDTSRSFYVRPISLNDPFPNRRKIGINWYDYRTNRSDGGFTYINYSEDGDRTGDSVYGKQPLYHIVLTPAMITDIKEYNRQEEKNDKGYLDWDTMEVANYNKHDSVSKFLSDLQTNHQENVDLPELTERITKVGDFK